jgi:predicted amidohydrolase YtcJ
MLMAGVPLPDLGEFEAALDRVVARFARHGVTALSAMCQTSDEGPAGEAGALEWAAWSMLVDRVPFDLQTILVAPTLAQVEELSAGPLHRPGADRRLDAVKLFLDGTLGGHTACMHAPYADGGGSGLLTLDPETAYERMVEAHLAGLQVCVHAIGDRANATAAELFSRLYREHPADPALNRHRIEHASVLDEPTVEALAANGVSAVVQPISLRSEQHWLAKRLGPERVERVYPYRRLLDAGVVVAGSSDAPIESIDVVAAMACAVDRLGFAPGQALTPAEALGLYTTGGAWARRSEHRVGRLAPGLRADLVELDGDPDVAVEDLEVTATTCAGVDLHRRAR